MEVVDHYHAGHGGGRLPKEARHPVEQGEPVGVRQRPELVARRRQQTPERLHPRPVRGRASAFPAASCDHACAGAAGLGRDLVHQAALPDPGLAAEQDDPSAAGERFVEGAAQLPPLRHAADEGAPRARGLLALDPPAGRPHDLRGLVEDRALEGLQLGAGLEPELGIEQHAGRLVQLECLCLPPGPVEGEHQLAPRPLPQRPLATRDSSSGISSSAQPSSSRASARSATAVERSSSRRAISAWANAS